METVTVTAPTPIETVTPIRPSEAIRLGCLLAPVQAFGGPGERNKREACAVAAMVRGGSADIDVFAGSDTPCPACGRSRRGPVLHLNDDHRWSRERIADWLEGLGL